MMRSPGSAQALVRHDYLDADAPDLPVVRDAGARRANSRMILLCVGGLDVLVGREVVGHQGDLRRVEDPVEAGLLELGDGDRRRDVVGQGQVDARLDDVARAHRVAARGPRQYLLYDRVSHQSFPFAAAALFMART